MAKNVFLTFHVTAVTSVARFLFKKNFFDPENAISIQERLLKESGY